MIRFWLHHKIGRNTPDVTEVEVIRISPEGISFALQWLKFVVKLKQIDKSQPCY